MPSRYSRFAKGKFARGVSKRYKVYKPAGVQLYKDVKYLKSIVNVEKKIIDSAITNTPDNAGDIQNLCLVAQGDDYTNRDGRRIKLQKMSLRLRMVPHVDSTKTSLRCILFKTRNDQAAAPTVTEVLEDVSSGVVSHFESDNHQNSWTILSDRVYTFDVNGKNHGFAEFTPNILAHCDYSGTGATEANTGRGAIYLLTISNEATNVPTLKGQCRVWFTDN